MVLIYFVWPCIVSLIQLAQMCVRRGPPLHMFSKLMNVVPSWGPFALSLCRLLSLLYWSRPAISKTP